MHNAKTKKSEGIILLNHFPKYFLRPYGTVEHLEEETFVKRLSTANWERFRRPNYAMSEQNVYQTLTEQFSDFMTAYHIMANPQRFAITSINSSNLDKIFKQDPTRKTLRQYLIETCTNDIGTPQKSPTKRTSLLQLTRRNVLPPVPPYPITICRLESKR